MFPPPVDSTTPPFPNRMPWFCLLEAWLRPVRVMFPSAVRMRLGASRSQIPGLLSVPGPLMPSSKILPVPVETIAPPVSSWMPALPDCVPVPSPIREMFPFSVSILALLRIRMPIWRSSPVPPIPSRAIVPVPVVVTRALSVSSIPALVLSPTAPVPEISMLPSPASRVDPDNSTSPIVVPSKLPGSIVTFPPSVKIWASEFSSNRALPGSRSPAMAFSSLMRALKSPPFN